MKAVTVSIVPINVSVTINELAQGIESIVEDRVAAATQIAISNGHRMAQGRTPERKVFRGGRRTTKYYSQFTPAEKRAERYARMRAGIPGNTYPLGVVIRRNQKQVNRVRELTQLPGGPAAFDTLTFAGLRELRPKRGAVHWMATFDLRTQHRGEDAEFLGGFLRSRTQDIPAYRTNRGWSAEIYNDAYYARFVEFGTSRSRAQPFLRPTMSFLERFYPREMRRQLAKLA